MIDRPELYFQLPPEPTWASTRDLILTKPVKSQPTSVENAERLMRAAAAGEIERRLPLLVAREGEAFRVIDGNATAAVAQKYNWKLVPITIEADERLFPLREITVRGPRTSR